MNDEWESKPRLVDQQNRVSLPPEVLEALQVKAGELVAFSVDGKNVRLHKVLWRVDRK